MPKYLGLAGLIVAVSAVAGINAVQAHNPNLYDHRYANHYHYPAKKMPYGYGQGYGRAYEPDGSPVVIVGRAGTFKCTVAARKRGGKGRVIGRTLSNSRRSWGPRTSQYRIKVLKSTACVVAAKKCGKKLRRLQRRGKFRYARCRHI